MGSFFRSKGGINMERKTFAHFIVMGAIIYFGLAVVSLFYAIINNILRHYLGTIVIVAFVVYLLKVKKGGE